MSRALHKSERALLCGPLRISAFSAINSIFNAEDAEIRRGPQRKASRSHFLCKAHEWQERGNDHTANFFACLWP